MPDTIIVNKLKVPLIIHKIATNPLHFGELSLGIPWQNTFRLFWKFPENAIGKCSLQGI